jgi:FtsZ-binding cell division protein ZapB
MTDIVARLRGSPGPRGFEKPFRVTMADAADEIERLREEIQQLKHDSTIFINERSDAICENFDLREENAELRETAIAALKEEEKKDD